MTGLDTLRLALRVPDETADPLDVPAIIERGRRLRRRRRLTALAGGVCAAAAVFGAVTGIGHLERPAPVPGLPAGPARSTPTPPPRHVTERPSSSPTAPMITPSPSPSAVEPVTRAPRATPTASSSLPIPSSAGGTPSASPELPGQGPSPSPTFSARTPGPTVSGQPASSPAVQVSTSPSQ